MILRLHIIHNKKLSISLSYYTLNHSNWTFYSKVMSININFLNLVEYHLLLQDIDLLGVLTLGSS